jgi:hypothetical protein
MTVCTREGPCRGLPGGALGGEHACKHAYRVSDEMGARALTLRVFVRERSCQPMPAVAQKNVEAERLSNFCEPFFFHFPLATTQTYVLVLRFLVGLTWLAMNVQRVGLLGSATLRELFNAT